MGSSFKGYSTHRILVSFLVSILSLSAVCNADVESTQACLGVKVKIEQSSIRIVEIAPGSNAEKAGLRKGDVIRQIGPVQIAGKNAKVHQFRKIVSQLPLDQLSAMKVQRDGREQIVQIQPDQRPKLGLYTLPPRPEGVAVRAVLPNSAAKEAGLMSGDMILKYGEMDFTERQRTTWEFLDAIHKSPYDKPIEIVINRAGYRIIRKVKYTKAPQPDLLSSLPNPADPNEHNSSPNASSYSSNGTQLRSSNMGGRQDTSTMGTVTVDMILQDMAKFEELYVRRGQGLKVSDKAWLKMADRFKRYRINDIPLNREDLGAFYLRCMLIESECYLFASQYLHASQPNSAAFWNAYDGGVKLLEMLLNIISDDLDYLPRYTFLLKEDADDDRKFTLHDYAGYETIGTGLDVTQIDISSSPKLDRKVEYKFGLYHNLESYREYARGCFRETNRQTRQRWAEQYDAQEEPMQHLRQIRTSETAKELLSHFCPWGGELFLFLKNDLHLANEIDMAILRPYAGDNPPMLCEFAINDNIPLHIVDIMERAINAKNTDVKVTNKTGGTINWAHDTQGEIRINRQKKILNWRMVQERPNYIIRFVSPRAYDIKPSEMLSYALKAVKLYFAGAKDLAVDEFTGYLLDNVGKIYGQNADIYSYSYFWVEANNWGLEDNLFLKRSMNKGKMFKQSVGYMLKYMEAKESEWNFEGIPPETSLMGTTYNGDRIPPIVIRSDIYGHEKVKEYEYYRSLRVQTFYQLDPAYLAYNVSGTTYDLSKNPVRQLAQKEHYLQNKIRAHKIAWPQFPNPGGLPIGVRGYTTDYSPKSQVLDLHLDKPSFARWEDDANEPIKAAIYSPVQKDKPLWEMEITKPKVIFQLANRHTFPKAWNRMQKDGFFQRNWHLYEGARGGDFPALLFTDYVVKITQGDKDREEIKVNFLQRPEKPRSGELIDWKPGYVVMEQEPNNVPPDLEKYTAVHVSVEFVHSYHGYLSALDPPGKLTSRTYDYSLMWTAYGSFRGNTFYGSINEKYSVGTQKVNVIVTVDPETLRVTSVSADRIENNMYGTKYSRERLEAKDLPALRESYGSHRCDLMQNPKKMKECVTKIYKKWQGDETWRETTGFDFNDKSYISVTFNEMTYMPPK